MHSSPPFVGATHVRIGHLYYPGGAFPNYLARYCRLITVNQNRTYFPISLNGSGVSVRLGSKLITFCSNHQIKNYDPKDVLFSFSDHGSLISSAGHATVNNPYGEEYQDISAFKFTEDMPIQNLSSYFFPLTDYWNGRALRYFMLGFPQKLQKYDDDRIGSVIVATDATIEGTSPNMEHISIYRMHRKLPWHPNGISGAPMFYLDEDRDGFYIGLSGIVIRAGNEQSPYVYAVNANRLAQFRLAFNN